MNKVLNFEGSTRNTQEVIELLQNSITDTCAVLVWCYNTSNNQHDNASFNIDNDSEKAIAIELISLMHIMGVLTSVRVYAQ